MAEKGRLSRLRARVEDGIRVRRDDGPARAPGRGPRLGERLRRARSGLGERAARLASRPQRPESPPAPKPGTHEGPVSAERGRARPSTRPAQTSKPASKPAYEAPRLGELGQSRRDELGDRLAQLRGAARGAAEGAWTRLPLGLRQRIVAGGALAVLVALIAFVIVPLAPCSFPGGDSCAPEDEAMALAPGDVLAYGHATLGTDGGTLDDARELGGKLPILVSDALAALPGATGRLLDYERDVRPWSGGEVALVVDSQGLEVERLLIFDVEDPDEAEAFATAQLGPDTRIAEVGEDELTVDSDGFAWAIEGGFLLLGPEDSVRRSLGVAAGREESLAADPDLARARELLPEDRIGDLFVSPELAALAAEDKQLGALDTFVNQAATEGVAVALTLHPDEIGLSARSLQDPDLADASGGFFSSLPAFEPRLTESIGADALAYLGLGSPGESATRLLDRTADAAPDLFAGLERFADRLSKREGVDIEGQLLPLLEGEVALTVEPTDGPGAETAEPAPGVAPSVGTPYVALLADGVDTAAAAETMAGLQAPIAAAIGSRGGAPPPLFETSEIAGVEAAGLQLSPIVDLTYATFDDRLVVGTSPLAVERARGGGDKLADDEGFEQLTDDLGDRPALLAYLDLRGLLTLGERIGLATDAGYARLAADLRTLEAASLAVRRSGGVLSTDLRIAVGERQEGPADEPVIEVDPG